MKIETWLPIFPGFYNTIFESNLENEVYSINQDRDSKELNKIDYEALIFDDKQFEIDTVKELCNIISSELKEYVYSIEYQTIKSPKQYNYINDSVDVLIDVNVEAVKNFIQSHIEEFKQYLKRNYTSCDGFISSYDNDLNSWIEYTNNFTDYSGSGHYLGSVLQFITNILEIDQESIYYQLKDNINEYEYIENTDQLNNNQSCIQCQTLIKDDNILKMIDKYKKIEGKIPVTCLCEKCLKVYV